MLGNYDTCFGTEVEVVVGPNPSIPGKTPSRELGMVIPLQEKSHKSQAQNNFSHRSTIIKELALDPDAWR